MAGEDFIELLADQLGGPLLPAEALEAPVHDPHILGDRQVGAGESSWKTQRTPSAWAAAAVQFPANLVPPTNKLARRRRQIAAQHMHEGGFAGAIVADKPEAFPRRNLEGHAGKGTDGAERFFDAVQSDGSGAQSPYLPADLRRILGGILDVGDAALFVVARLASRFRLVDLQEGHGQILRHFLAVEDHLRTQKASVETPGAIETDMVS